MSSEWKYPASGKEHLKCYLLTKEAYDHPLRSNGITVSVSEIRKTGSNTSSRTSSTISLDPLTLDGTDPLSHFARIDSTESDPLTRFGGDHVLGNHKTKHSARINNSHSVDNEFVDDVDDVGNESWSQRRSGILSKFTTGEKLTIISSFLHGGGVGGGSTDLIRTQTTVSEKVKNRLEQLDDFDENSIHKMIDLTQQEYQIRIEQLNHELIQAWNTDQRVNALKIVIQCSKLLADTSVLAFYPSQFVLITDILDNFGKLVYERLRTKADYFEPSSNTPKALPLNFTVDMVPEGVKETCLNWFYKIASIRDLLPRLYLEMSILKSYSFLSQTEFDQTLDRLTHMIRGIGDPLVAAYARCYLCRVGLTVSNSINYIKENINDLLFVYHTILLGSTRIDLTRQRIDNADYLGLYAPALDWIMHSLALRATETDLDEYLVKCQDKKNNGLWLQSILSTFPKTFISTKAKKIVHILSMSDSEGITKSQLFRLLGIKLSKCAPPENQRLAVLNGAWRTINTLTHGSEFIHCVEPWAEYISQHFGVKEVDTLLGEIIVRMNQNRYFEKHYNELQSISNNIIENIDDLEALLSSENFLPLMDLFQKELIRVEVCKNIMNTYKSKIAMRSDDDLVGTDSVVINALMFVCKALNDSMSAITGEDERRQTTILISHFIRSARFGLEFERQLTFYADARAAFPNLDGVFITLVQCVNLLAIKTRRIVNGRHTRKTTAFVKSCAAYSFITIPSIASVVSRMDLYLMSGQVALLNLCFGQADAFFEASINLIMELPKTCEISGKPKSTENYLISFISNLLSTLIIVPDSPEQGVLYLVRSLIETAERLSFENDSNCLARIYLNILDMLLVAGRDKYPYHIPNVISNDELYGSDPKFIIEVHSMCSKLIESILAQLKQLADNNNLRAQCSLSLDLFQKLVLNANLTNEKMFTLSVNLWNLAMKNRKFLDVKFPGKILMNIQQSIGKTEDQQQRHAREQLTTKMKIKM